MIICHVFGSILVFIVIMLFSFFNYHNYAFIFSTVAKYDFWSLTQIVFMLQDIFFPLHFQLQNVHPTALLPYMRECVMVFQTVTAVWMSATVTILNIQQPTNVMSAAQ